MNHQGSTPRNGKNCTLRTDEGVAINLLARSPQIPAGVTAGQRSGADLVHLGASRVARAYDGFSGVDRVDVDNLATGTTERGPSPIRAKTYGKDGR
jgi:hypothetical protein